MHFMNGVVFALNGCNGLSDRPSFNSVKQIWKDFTAQFRRENDPIPGNITISVTSVRAFMSLLSLTVFI